MAEGHKWYAAIYDRMMAPEERGILREIRTHVVGGARGRILEVGVGTGANFPYYKKTNASAVVATEPDPFMLERARRRLQELALSVDLHQSPAEELPFEDSSFDTVITTLVLCTVEDLQRSLHEIRRVLTPSGQFRFYEHVRFVHPLAAFMQDVVTPAWRWFGAGCHPNRDIAAAIGEAGFRIVDLRRSQGHVPIPPMCVSSPRILGVAHPA
ncbi:MAG: class I SAM-dependent methyltransferase [Chloroflexota bacterium]|nr:class I SAM-dependent methyltransferase [Chloroflexota bacterium]